MADTTTRTLRLLSLLQRRRYWPGPELADRLDVSDRTLRRDIDRLRDLGYAVESERGVDGGYRLAGTSGDTVLLLDDDETIALAVALHRAAGESGELAEASLGALTKTTSMLRPQQRSRVEAVRVATAVSPLSTTTAPPLVVLDTVAASCRDHVRLAFEYTAADGAATTRYVEPLQIVTVVNRWYLVAHDVDRDDWRTFRLDRMSAPVPARNTFSSRTPPADDLREYIRASISGLSVGHRIVVDADVAGDEVRRLVGRWVDVDDLDGHRCRITMDADSFVWPTHVVTSLDADFVVVDPVAFADHLSAVGERLRRSVGH